MRFAAKFTVPALSLLLLGGCASSGSWQGLEAKKAYDAAQAESSKNAAVAENNDDYYEVHADGRIYVFSDLKDLQIWKQTGEVPLVVTQIGTGPSGETVKLQLNKMEANAMVETVGYKGASQRMYEGELSGAEKGFHGEVISNTRIYVFDNARNLVAYKSSGHVACGVTRIGAGPSSQTVVFAQDCETAAKLAPNAAIARFNQNHGLK